MLLPQTCLNIILTALCDWSLEKEIHEEHQARRIDCCPNGDMVVSGGYPGLYILDSEGNFKMPLTSTESDANKRIGYVKYIAVSPLGYILLVDGTKWIKVFDLDYRYLHCFDTLTPDDHPNTDIDLECIAVDREGKVLVGDCRRGIITIHTCPDGRVVRKIKCRIGADPSMIVNSKNQILLHFRPHSSVHNKVVAIDYSGNQLFSFIPTTNEAVSGDVVRPGGIVCDKEGNMYIAMDVSLRFNTGHIHKYSPTGTFLRCIAQGLYWSRDLSFSHDGSLLIANRKSILKYT